MYRQWLLSLFFGVLFFGLMQAVCVAAGPAVNDYPVHLSNQDGKTVLSNGIITAVFNENGTVNSLIKNGMDLVKNLPAGKSTFYIDYNAEKKFHGFASAAQRVISNSDAEAHIAFTYQDGLLSLERHIILKKGDSGLYSYVIARNNAGREFTLSELRTVYRLDMGIFDNAYNAERKGKQPTQSYLKQFKKIQDETYLLPDGEKYTNGDIYSKYDYAGYFSENDFWGQYGHDFGFWFIPVSTEYYPGGPLKQDLLVHYDAIVLNYMTGAHFGTGDFVVPVNWKKFYGPWYIYINQGNEAEVIQDAQQKARQEKKKWPYQWVDEELYPKERSSVTGTITVTHQRSAGEAMVVLAQPGSELLQQAGGYIFYAQADKKGNFKIDNVRPGQYTLYAYTTQGDITSEFQKNIFIDKKKVDIGQIIWDAPYHSSKLWQLGVADRSDAEFKFGNELRNYKWHTLVPENLDYFVGQSKENEDWYYAQAKDGMWSIHFNLDKISSPQYYLTVAIAGTTTAKGGSGLTISVNGKPIKTVTYKNDASIYRSATRSGAYHVEHLTLAPEMFKAGENIITFTTNNNAVMYDTILLECD